MTISQFKGLILKNCRKRMLTFACCVHAWAASQIQIQNCTNVQAGKKYAEERSGREETEDYCRALWALQQPVLCRRREGGTDSGKWVSGRHRGQSRAPGWPGGHQVTPRLGFQGSQPTAGKHSGLHLPLLIKWHYLNPASHSGSELAD